MDTKYLQYMITIAKRKNMTKAAEELYVSQSSLSQYVSKLEAELNTPLFYRNKGNLTLTPAGELYIQAAERIIDIKKEFLYNLQHMEHKGHISIGVTSMFGLEMLTGIIPEFKKKYPNVTIEISELNVPTLTAAIQEEKIDCAIMALNTTDVFKKETVDILRREEVFLGIPKIHAYHKDFPDKNFIDFKSFKDYFSEDHMLLSKKGSTLRALSDQLFNEMQVHLKTVCETNSIVATQSMVAMGIGITLVPSSCISHTSQIAYYSLKPALYRLNVFVRRKNWNLGEPEEALCQSIIRYFNK